METITFDSVSHKIEWDGPGTYVSARYRGALHFHKLPSGARPKDGVVVRDFAEKPQPKQEESSHPLWETIR